MEAKEANGIRSRTQRADYQATADPALNEAADRTADIKLLDYGELYDLWERQQWQTQELDFSQDRDETPRTPVGLPQAPRTTPSATPPAQAPQRSQPPHPPHRP